jgi:hypothetical protein
LVLNYISDESKPIPSKAINRYKELLLNLEKECENNG